MSAPAPPYVVERVETSDVLKEELDLRVEVFVKEQGFALELETDEHDQLETTAHFVLRLVQNPGRPVVGTVRAHRYAEKAYKIGRICVRADCRKYGFGSVLIARAEQWVIGDARESYSGVKTVRALIEAQEQAIPFYNRVGYEGEGEFFFDEGVPHRKMVKQLQL